MVFVPASYVYEIRESVMMARGADTKGRKGMRLRRKAATVFFQRPTNRFSLLFLFPPPPPPPPSLVAGRPSTVHCVSSCSISSVDPRSFSFRTLPKTPRAWGASFLTVFSPLLASPPFYFLLSEDALDFIVCRLCRLGYPCVGAERQYSR
jgi:hypothetical protein